MCRAQLAVKYTSAYQTNRINKQQTKNMTKRQIANHVEKIFLCFNSRSLRTHLTHILTKGLSTHSNHPAMFVLVLLNLLLQKVKGAYDIIKLKLNHANNNHQIVVLHL